MKIAFVAGCLNRQKHLEIKKHHHSIVRTLVKDQTGEYPAIVLGSYQNYFNLAGQVDSILAQQPDVLVLFIRPFAMQSAIKPFIRYRTNQYKQRVRLHPALSGKSFTSNLLDEFTDLELSTDKKPMPHWLVKANVLSGKLLGLNSWAVNNIVNQVMQIHNRCASIGAKLIVTGPLLYPSRQHINDLCIEVNTALEKLCIANNIAHVSLTRHADDAANPLLFADGRHVTPEGHQYIGSAVYKIIAAWQH